MNFDLSKRIEQDPGLVRSATEPSNLSQTPEDGHTFRIEAYSRGSYGVVGQEGHTDADWFAEEPFVIEVRAWNLHDALRLAAEQPLHTWRLGERRLDVEELEVEEL